MIAFMPLLVVAAVDLSCGTRVVSGTQNTVVLRDRLGQIVVSLPVKDDSLTEPLPVKNCGATRVVVDYHGQNLVADRWSVVLDQSTYRICMIPGHGENSGMMGHMEATDDAGCKVRPPQSTEAPTGASTAAHKARKK